MGMADDESLSSQFPLARVVLASVVRQRVSVSITTGDTATQYQIVDWTYTANQLRIDVTLGDFDRNIFTLVNDKTTALDNSIG